MDFNEIITFEGGINTDDTPQGVPKGDYRDFSYCRLGYNSGNAFAVETSSGTIEINNPAILGDDKVIGATQWLKENAIVYFLYKDTGIHEIWVYYISTQTHVLALQGSELNFSPDWPIFHSNVVDDILKWTDGRWDPVMYESDGTRLFNPPYQINLSKALELPSPNGFYGIIDLQTIDAIKWPMEPPIVSYFTDTTRNDNKLRNKLFKFIIQPIYENGELGVWSMYSSLELPDRSELVSGTNWVYLNNDNAIKIQFDTGSKIIRKFNIAVQQFDSKNLGATPPFGVFLQLDKVQDNINDNEFYTVYFYGDAAISPAIDVFKNYDRLPIIADCQEYLPTNQLVYSNFREGYDKPTDPPFTLDVWMGYKVKEVVSNPFQDLLFYVEYDDNFGCEFWIYGYRDIILPYDLPFPFAVGMVMSVPLPNGDTFNYTITQADIDNAFILPGAFQRFKAMLGILGNQIAIACGLPTGFVNQIVVDPTYLIVQYEFDDYPGVNNKSYQRIPFQVLSNTMPSLKVGATHEFGIVYGDRAYRDSTVYTVDAMNVFVPWFYDIDKSLFSDQKNPFTVTPEIVINHIPPVWATKYWIVAKPATEILSFGQYITNSDTAAYVNSGYTISIKLDSNRYIIEIDNYYETTFVGAKIRHEIKEGDKIRFIRQNAHTLDWIPYLELDVVKYVKGGGLTGGDLVYTNIFDTSIIDNNLALSDNRLFGQFLEIYTPRPSTDDTGSIFISTWNDVTEAIQIINPHTEDRSHGSPVQYYVQYSPTVFGGIYFYLTGDQTQLLGTIWPITIHYTDGTIDQNFALVLSATYDSAENATGLDLDSVVPSPTIAYITFNGQDQIVNNLSNTTSAYYPVEYGDVYLRQRLYRTGLDDAYAYLYYYVEDPHYSDYWSSDIHNTGRIRIEDQNAKMVHRKASSIHSDSFIVGTQVNGLSSFALDNQNIEEMNPFYGEIIRTYMSGREGKTLKCLQPKRENSIYIQYYPNEVGSDSTVRVSNKTFASWFDYKSLFGCSDAGATAVLPNGATMYFDNNSGVFIYSGGNGQIVVSEIDPDTGKDYKFRTKTKELAKAYNESLALGITPLVRTYVNETVGEVGFAFSFDDEETYEHVVFDYVNMRWRSTYDYNFRQFCNLGQTLVGWGKNNQLYVHNQDGVWTFHGDSFIQKVTFVSNENPLMLKRYQDITLVSDDSFSIEASSEPNRSYPLGMKTIMSEQIINMYEGYGKTNYRKNLYDPRFRINSNVSETNTTTWTLDGNQTSLIGETITIIQDTDKNIYTGVITNPVYNVGPNTTDIELVGLQPNTIGVDGTWYLSEKVLLNGEDIRANALTHTLSYDPAAPSASGEGSVLFSVGIKGVLS